MNGVMTGIMQDHGSCSQIVFGGLICGWSVGERLAFQAGTGEFEPLRPLQSCWVDSQLGVEPSVVMRMTYNRSLEENPW